MPPRSVRPIAEPLFRGLRPKYQPTTYCLDRRRCISAYGYTQAKALVYSQYGEPQDVLSLHGHSISPAHSTNVTLRFLAAPINPADINQIQGVYPTKPPFTSSIGTAQPSAVAGNEGVAEVISTGSGVKTLGKGDWVVMKSTGFGTWRTHAQTDESNLLQIEDHSKLTPTQVGTVSVNPCTAYRMLRDFAPIREGDWFIQNGANSGVGRAAIQFGRLWGLKSINVVRNRPGIDDLKKELHGLGADVVITEDELMDRSFPDHLRSLTSSSPIPLGLNCVGGKPAVALAKALAPSAHLVTYGAMSKQPLTLPAGLLIFKNITFDGFWVSRWSDAHPSEKKRTVEEILGLMRESKLKDTPVSEVEWGWETKADVLKQAVAGTLDGFRGGKAVFVFKE
ncbi:MAG: mitochondrial 2-enoyl thioester reductase [Caeruleum heppii]|nr:MAG: mitochondrial 2-enoyl thioester reductase [Caeruleum heppii]